MQQRDIARVVPVGDVDVVVLQQGARGFAQQRGEVARERRGEQDSGLFRQAGVVLAKAQQGAEGQGEHGLFNHRDLGFAHRHRMDVVRRARMREPQARQHIAGGGHLAHHRALGLLDPERCAQMLGSQTQRRHQVGLELVGLIQHEVLSCWMGCVQARNGPEPLHPAGAPAMHKGGTGIAATLALTRSIPWPKQFSRSAARITAPGPCAAG
ncbi:hypothetical protein Y695_04010 [Hydrogenophaga sp. T4]|nr:hypothetical protein Y695_04010 [Hydrogenophaga sp. T4]